MLYRGPRADKFDSGSTFSFSRTHIYISETLLSRQEIRSSTDQLVEEPEHRTVLKSVATDAAVAAAGRGSSAHGRRWSAPNTYVHSAFFPSFKSSCFFVPRLHFPPAFILSLLFAFLPTSLRAFRNRNDKAPKPNQNCNGFFFSKEPLLSLFVTPERYIQSLIPYYTLLLYSSADLVQNKIPTYQAVLYALAP